MLAVCRGPFRAEGAVLLAGLRVVGAHDVQHARAQARQAVVAGLQEEVARVEVHRLEAQGAEPMGAQQALGGLGALKLFFNDRNPLF